MSDEFRFRRLDESFRYPSTSLPTTLQPLIRCQETVVHGFIASVQAAEYFAPSTKYCVLSLLDIVLGFEVSPRRLVAWPHTEPKEKRPLEVKALGLNSTYLQSAQLRRNATEHTMPQLSLSL